MKPRFAILISLGIALLVLASITSCQQSPNQQSAKPAAAPTAAASGGVAIKEVAEKPAAAAADAKAPTAVLEIMPVPANAANQYAVKAPLPGTTTTVAMGTTGLRNVSIGVPVTLQGSVADPKVPAKTYSWELTKPSASKSALDKNDGQVARFTPDVAGMYKIDLIEGNDSGKSGMASIQIRAGTYLGVENGNCEKCHETKFEGWSKTPHASKLKRELNGGSDPPNSHYNEGCLRCHTVGYAIGVANGGFAEIQAKLGWKFPALGLIQAARDNFSDIPAELKKLGNIQCENCHGPASDHVKNGTPMGVSLDEGVCNVCHNGGGTHVKGEMLKYAKHADREERAWSYPTGPDHQDCVRCHSGYGFISFLKNPTEKASWNNTPHTVACAVCHDPHSEANTDQLRIVGKPVEIVPNGVTRDFGLSAVCVECHNARTNPEDATKGTFPHYSAAGEMLSNVGGVDYGLQIPNSKHDKVGIVPVSELKDTLENKDGTKLFGGNIPGPCVVCHMWPTPPDKDPNRFKVGDHSFNAISPDGKFQYTDSCQECHPGVKDFNFPAHDDYDGNGKAEGVMDEMAGMLKVLQKAIADSGVKPIKGHPYFDDNDVKKATDKQKNAIYNYLYVRGVEDTDGKAAAMHNFYRSMALLQASYKDLTGKDVPNARIVYNTTR